MPLGPNRLSVNFASSQTSSGVNTALIISLAALFASPSRARAETQISMTVSDTDTMPSRCLLAPGLTWHCKWIQLKADFETTYLIAAIVMT